MRIIGVVMIILPPVGALYCSVFLNVEDNTATLKRWSIAIGSVVPDRYFATVILWYQVGFVLRLH